KARLGQRVACAREVKRTIAIHNSINVLGNKPQRDKWCANLRRVFAETQVSLVGAISADPEIVNVTRQHRGQLFFPRLFIAHFLAVSERIAKGSQQWPSVYYPAGALTKRSGKAFLPTQVEIVQSLQSREIGLSNGVGV